MDGFKQLLKTGKLARFCKVGAWVVAGLGALQIILEFYITYQQYRITPREIINTPYFIYSTLLTLVNVLPTAIATLFYFLILYIASRIFHSFAETPVMILKEQNDTIKQGDKDVNVTYTSIDEPLPDNIQYETVSSDKMRKRR